MQSIFHNSCLLNMLSI